MKINWNWKKVLLLLAILGIVLLGAAYGAYKGYRIVREVRLVKQAKGFMEKSEPRKALLCLQGALRYNPNNLEAVRLMADLLEQGRSPAALLYRSRVVELNPNSLDDRLSLVQAAMASRDFTMVTNTLAGVNEAGKKTAAYHKVAGSVAAAMGNVPEAESHFREAARLEPENPVPQLNLAVLGLGQTNQQVLAQARSTLTLLSSNPTNGALRVRALRELFADAIRHNQTNAALAFSHKVLLETNSTFNDRLMRLDVLRVASDPGFDLALQTFKKDASQDPAKAHEMAAWQFNRSSPAKALAWIETLPQAFQTNQALAVMAAECRSATGDWQSLQTNIVKQTWGELEFIRRAYLARALREQNLEDSAKIEWSQALKFANNQRAPLVMLLRLAAQWRWNTEGEEILSLIINRYPSERWAYQALTQVYYMTGRTRPLMVLCSQQAKRNPDDLPTKNNLAMTAMLLDATEMQPHDLARELYDKAPTNASFASTYAFSLYQQKKTNEALQVMTKLTPQQLQSPTIASYYALVLHANGNMPTARQYFDRISGTNAPTLLPEEKRLLDRARSTL